MNTKTNSLHADKASAHSKKRKDVELFLDVKTHRQRVIEYLYSEFERLNLQGGSKLPPSRILAQRLQVSVSTVQQAYRVLADQGCIRLEVGNGTFLITPPSKKKHLHIAISMAKPNSVNSSPWSSRIAAGILQAASHASLPISVLSVSELLNGAHDARFRHVVAETDGLICISSSQETLVSAFAAAEKPCVYFNSPNILATIDFVSPDYFSFSAHLVDAGLRAGAKTFAILLNNRTLESSSSSQLRIAGASHAMARSMGRSTHLIVEPVDSMSEQSGYSAAKTLFDGSQHRPDLIYCAGDYLALGALRYLNEAGIQVPDEVMVVGGSGLHNPQTALAGLSMMDQPLENLSQRAVSMLLQRIKFPQVPTPGEFMSCGFFSGRTTTDLFNEHFVQIAKI